jgi:hypothetical protein
VDGPDLEIDNKGTFEEHADRWKTVEHFWTEGI